MDHFDMPERLQEDKLTAVLWRVNAILAGLVVFGAGIVLGLYIAAVMGAAHG